MRSYGYFRKPRKGKGTPKPAQPGCIFLFLFDHLTYICPDQSAFIEMKIRIMAKVLK